MTQDVNCVMADLPHSIKAYTVLNNDRSYTIILNSRHSYEQHLASYHHEMHHIENGDYDKRCDADILELQAHHM